MDICKFTYHNVGQGLFYTGRIQGHDFVYDCGVEKQNLQYLEYAIQWFKCKLVLRNHLPLMIVSHFHYDHISGLNLLLDEHMSVDCVVVPYFSPIERLIIALKKPRGPEWYHRFLHDPVRYLFDKKVNRVIVLGKEEVYASDRLLNIISDAPNDESGGEHFFHFEKMRDDEITRAAILRNDRHWSTYIKGKKLLVKRTTYPIHVGNFWLFKFCNIQAPDKNIDDFKQCLDNNGLDLRKSAAIKAAIVDPKQLTILKECYKLLHGDYNDTSLMLFHGPTADLEWMSVISVDSMSRYIRELHYAPPILAGNNGFPAGQLLTGDVNLKIQYSEIKQAFARYYRGIRAVSIPHHGSHKTWCGQFMADLSGPTFWIASAGVSNNHGHPHHSTIADIRRSHNEFLWANEFCRIEIMCRLPSQ